MLRMNKPKFNIVYTPDNIDGKINTENKSVVRVGVLDDKSRLFTTTKGEIAFTYFDVDRNGYRTAKNKWTINYIGAQ
jgi:hypothetical protein